MGFPFKGIMNNLLGSIWSAGIICLSAILVSHISIVYYII
jgi:hypothetical protein